MKGHLSMKRCLATLLAAIFLSSAGLALAASEVPYNGGFESVALGEPLGWQVRGAWFCRAEAACAGRNGILVRPDFSKEGDRLTPSGYLLATAGETLKLSVTYTSTDGGPAVGLIFCDPFGRPVGEGCLETLPASATWTTYERTITLSSDFCPASYSSVRPFFVVEHDGVAAKLDGVTLTREHTETAQPLVPKVKIENRPNLLSNPTMLLAADGTMAAWTALDRDGFSAQHAVVMPITDSASGTLALTGADQPAAWLSDLTTLDASLPHAVRAEVSTADLTLAQATLLVRVFDPVDAGAVWLQYTVPAEATKGPTQLRIPLPRLTNSPSAARVQIALLLDAGGSGAATMAKVALEPEPLTLTIRPAATSGGFQLPKDVSLFITAVNNTANTIKPKVYMKVVDAQGQQAAYEARALTSVPSRSAAFFPFKPKLASAGDYKAVVRILDGTKDLGSAEYSFNVGGPVVAAVETGPVAGALDTPMLKAFISDTLGPDKKPTGPKAALPASASFVHLYVELKQASPDGLVSITLYQGDNVSQKQVVQADKDDRFVVSFYSQTAETMPVGKWSVSLRVGDQVAGTIPFTVGPVE